MSVHLHLVVPDLFPPKELPPAIYAGLGVGALERVMARAEPQPPVAESLEEWLCAMFGVPNGEIAPVTLRAEGLTPGEAYWLRADPVHLEVRHDGTVLLPTAQMSADETRGLCASLNAHFSADGLELVAPHPERWYLRLPQAPAITTQPLSQVVGRNIGGSLPDGRDALRWHGMLNEMQMLLYSHPVNEAREARGELRVNSLWLWGGGHDVGTLCQPFSRVLTDNPLVKAFTTAANISHTALSGEERYCPAAGDGSALVVWDGLGSALQEGDLGKWRDELQRLEQRCFEPAVRALHDGRLDRITLDVLQGKASARFSLTRGAAWKFWRRGRLHRHAVM